MKNKIFVSLIIIMALLSISLVSASENTTDVIEDSEMTDGLAICDDGQAIAISDDGVKVSDDDSPQEEGIVKNASEISSAGAVGYTTFSTKFVVKLTSSNKNLASKQIKITVNGDSYNRTTDANGEAILNIQLPKGIYDVNFYFAGDENTTSSNGTSTITVKDSTKTSLKLGDKYINYRQGLKSLFYVKLVDEKGKPIKNQWVTFKVNGKEYTAKTNSEGNANIHIGLKKGTYKIKYYFTKTAPYLSSSGSAKIKVKASMGKGNGYWIWSAHMNKVSLKSLSKKGVKQVLLHVQSIAIHGKSAVVNWIQKAHKYGIKVHLWMQVCYESGVWTRPVNPDGSLKYGFMNKKINQAKRYAKIKGVDGIHFDYVRFGGTAHLYSTSVKAINYFTKKASIEVHKVKPNCIISAAVMPEPKMMHYYYGQDIPAMSKYMDAIIPMAYKGNYHKNTAWIKSVTDTFVKQSNGAKIWTGLQSYKSDSSAVRLSQSELLKDSNAAMNGGAGGIILFRYGISCNFNFKKI